MKLTDQKTPTLWIDPTESSISGHRRCAFFASVIAFGLAGCGTAREQGVPERTAASTTQLIEASPTNSASSAQDASSAAPSAPAAAETAEVTPPAKKPRVGELAHFYTALDELAAGMRKDHVRILWLGDSHGQADFWSGKLRTVLQKRFGNGGPGFIHLGLRGYRHDGAEIIVKERFRTLPRAPSTSAKTGDGVLGLGGVLTSPRDPGSEAAIEIRDKGLSGKLSFDLCYRFTKAGESISVSVTGKKPVTLSAGKKVSENPPLQHFTLTAEIKAEKAEASDTKNAAESAKPPRITVSATQGAPFFCGVVVEAEPDPKPGVVVDTLGINGARYTTALAWDEQAWLSELSRRAPELVIFEYGTNEAGDVGIKEDTYRDRVTRLVTRMRKKLPEADCVVLAPTDRADQESRSSRIRDIFRDAAKENGCFFWDTIEQMGGKGSMRAWRGTSPPKGAKDGIHLTVNGYYELGEKLASDLLAKY